MLTVMVLKSFTKLDKYPFNITESWTFVLNCCINSIEMTVWLWEIHENQTIILFWYQIIQTIFGMTGSFHITGSTVYTCTSCTCMDNQKHVCGSHTQTHRTHTCL